MDRGAWRAAEELDRTEWLSTALLIRWHSLTPQILDKVFPSATAAKSLQSCPNLCDPIDGSPPGSPVPGILQTRTLEWVAISFSNAWKWEVKAKSLSHARLLVTPWTAAHQAPPSMGFSRQEYWSGVPLPSPKSSLRKPQSHCGWIEIKHWMWWVLSCFNDLKVSSLQFLLYSGRADLSFPTLAVPARYLSFGHPVCYRMFISIPVSLPLRWITTSQSWLLICL